MTENSLLIGIPTIGIVHAAPFMSLACCIGTTVWAWKERFGRDADVSLFVPDRLHIVDARNAIAKTALEGEFDYVMWLDDDMDPPPDLVMGLLSLDTPIASGLYTNRARPARTMTYAFDGARRSRHVSMPDWTNKLAAVDGVGMGCVLMRREVLKRVWDDTGGVPFKAGPTAHGGEDIYFFEKASAAGYKVAIDGNLKVGHLGVQASP